MSNDDRQSRPTRATSPRLLVARAAKSLVAPFQVKLGDWQAEAIKLEAIVERGRADADAGEAVRALHGFVAQQAAEFETAMETVPEPVQKHGRVTDTLMVLRRLEQRLAKTLSAIEDGPAKR